MLDFLLLAIAIITMIVLYAVHLGVRGARRKDDRQSS